MKTAEKSKEIIEDIARPVIEVAHRILRIFLIIDESGSMGGAAIGIVNQTCREIIPILREIMKNNAGIDIELLCISFNHVAKWHIGSQAVKIKDAIWHDLRAGGGTNMGKAIELLTGALTIENMPKRGIPPVCILLSDGANGDGSEYDQAIDALDREFWGSKAVRLSIGIGDSYDNRSLELFCNQPEIGVLEAKDVSDIEQHLKLCSTQVAGQLVKNRSNPGAAKNNNVAIQPAPQRGKPMTNPKLVIG